MIHLLKDVRLPAWFQLHCKGAQTNRIRAGMGYIHLVKSFQ